MDVSREVVVSGAQQRGAVQERVAGAISGRSGLVWLMMAVDVVEMRRRVYYGRGGWS